MKKNKNLIVVGVSRSGQHFILDQIHSWNTPYNVYKFENAADDETYNQKLHSYKVDTSLPTKHLTIYRDYPNWLASIVKYVNERESHADLIAKNARIRKYMKHWRDVSEFTGPTGVTLNISYNGFTQSRDVREFLCENLDGTYSEERLYNIPTAGGGSSFTGIEKINLAEKIDNRIDHILDSKYREEYLNYLSLLF